MENQIAELELRLVELKGQLAQVQDQGVKLPEGALIPADTPAEEVLEVASRLAVEELALRQQSQARVLMQDIAIGAIKRTISDVQADLDEARRAEVAVKVEQRRDNIRKKQAQIDKLCSQLQTLLAEVQDIAGTQQAQEEHYFASRSSADFWQMDRRSPVNLPELQEKPDGTFVLRAKAV